MRGNLYSVKKFWIEEIRTHKIIYILFVAILSGSIYFRVFRTEDLLRFYFDQGRDALVVWRFWHEGKFFLVGPVTGLEGIFLGPAYYYLIAPFYLIGRGNPVYPAVFLAILSIFAICITYYLGWQMQSRVTGLIAATIAGFSYYMILAGRWLANPTPILLSSVLLLLSMWKILNKDGKEIKKDKKSIDLNLIAISLLVGISLQFEAASAVFYIPVVLVFVIWIYILSWGANRKPHQVWMNWRTGFVALILLFFSFLPQILFNFRHENILFNNFKKVLIEEKSFRSPFTQYNLTKKKQYFWEVFSTKIFPGYVKNSRLYYLAALLGILIALKTKQKAILLLLIFIGVPMIGYLFFQGNYGNIYDYYMTGYYLPMILLFSIGLGALWRNILGKIIVLAFFIPFLNLNLALDNSFISAGIDGPTHITLGNQLQAVNWVFNDASNLQEFNVDVYVPPVIPYSYDYLFLWQGSLRCGKSLCGMVSKPQKEVVYVLFEVDPPHPERLENWLIKYKENSQLEKEVKFGGITVQKRKRV